MSQLGKKVRAAVSGAYEVTTIRAQTIRHTNLDLQDLAAKNHLSKGTSGRTPLLSISGHFWG